MTYKRQAVRVFERSRIIGQRGALYSVIGIAVLDPTVEFPNLAVSLSLSNGKSYAFSQIKIEELPNLVEALQEWTRAIMELEPGLREKSQVLMALREKQDAELAAAQAQLDAARRMVNLADGAQ